MLRILDYNNVKITKVKSWIVYFDYNDRHFFVKEGSEDDSILELYEKTYCDNGKYECELLNSVICSCYPTVFLHPKFGIKKSITLPHNQIDIKAFVLHLMHIGLVKGNRDLEKQLNATLRSVKENNRRIRELNAIIARLDSKNTKLLSMQYSSIN